MESRQKTQQSNLSSHFWLCMRTFQTLVTFCKLRLLTFFVPSSYQQVVGVICDLIVTQ